MNSFKPMQRGQVWNITKEFSRILTIEREQNLGSAETAYLGFTEGVVIISSDVHAQLDPLIVVPLITTKVYKDDILIPRLLLSNHKMDRIYPSICHLFPVSESNLVDYVCTLPDRIMDEIDKKLKSLLFNEKQ